MRRILALSILFGIFCTANAQTQLQAQFYPREHLQISTQWLVPHIRSSNSANANLMVAKTNLTELHLKIPPEYQGKNVKIYLSLPLQTPGLMGFEGLEVNWQGYDNFINGSVKPGSRSLLYEGVVPNTVSGRIVFTLYIDARFVAGNLDFKPQYTIEGTQ